MSPLRRHQAPMLACVLLSTAILHAQQGTPKPPPPPPPPPPPSTTAAMPPPRFQLIFHNEMGSAFGIKEVSWTMDKGQETKISDASTRINRDGDLTLFDNTVTAGDHLVDVTLLYEGTGYGVFSYLKGYQFKLTTRHLFQAEDGKEVQVKIVGFEKGNMTTEIKDRPAIRVDASLRDMVAEQSAQEAKRLGDAQRAAAKDIQLKTAEEAYDVKMEALEARSRELQMQIEQTKKRVSTLQDSLLSGNTNAGRARVAYKNDMGASFRLRELHIFLDGAAIRDEVDESGEGIGKQERIDLFDGNIIPGTHTLNITVVYQGVGYGVFADINNSAFKLRSTHTFTIEKGKVLTLQIVAYEQGDSNTQLKDRPTIRFDAAVEALAPPAPPAATSTGSTPAPAPR